MSLDIEKVFEIQRMNTSNLARMSVRERIARLKRIEDYLKDKDQLQDLYSAMYNDFHKPETEVMATEVGIVQAHIKHIKKNLNKWMGNKNIRTPLPLIGTRSYIRYEPKGTVLIIAPWNFPLNLSLVPLLYAIAAGNSVILKPSELAYHSSSFIQKMIYDLFDESEIAVFEGDSFVAQKLLDLPFNHIFFTGSPRIGKLVMEKAAHHLSDITLELGGKSPAIIDETANIKKIAKKLVWAKFINNGQACISPDYLIIHESVKDEFVKAFVMEVDNLYDPSKKGIQNNPDYCRIINIHHFKRLHALYENACENNARTICGGDFDESELFISPTLMENISSDMQIMEEEIFGPILPLIEYKNRNDVCNIVENNPSPLIVYIASNNEDNTNYFIENTSSGSTLVNDYLLSYSNPNLPFGGVNNSGIGKSLGHHGFVSFSNQRSVMHRKWGSMNMLFPPYTENVRKIITLAYRWM